MTEEQKKMLVDRLRAGREAKKEAVSVGCRSQPTLREKEVKTNSKKQANDNVKKQEIKEESAKEVKPTPDELVSAGCSQPTLRVEEKCIFDDFKDQVIKEEKEEQEKQEKKKKESQPIGEDKKKKNQFLKIKFYQEPTNKKFLSKILKAIDEQSDDEDEPNILKPRQEKKSNNLEQERFEKEQNELIKRQLAAEEHKKRMFQMARDILG